MIEGAPQKKENKKDKDDEPSRRDFLKTGMGALAALAGGTGAASAGVLQSLEWKKAKKIIGDVKPARVEEAVPTLLGSAKETGPQVSQEERERQWHANHSSFMEGLRKGNPESIAFAAALVQTYEEELLRNKQFKTDIINQANRYPDSRALQAGVENTLMLLGERQAWLETMIQELGSIPEVTAFLEAEDDRRSRQIEWEQKQKNPNSKEIIH